MKSYSDAVDNQRGRRRHYWVMQTNRSISNGITLLHLMKRVLRFSTCRGTRLTQCNSFLTLSGKRGAGDDGEGEEGQGRRAASEDGPGKIRGQRFRIC